MKTACSILRCSLGVQVANLLVVAAVFFKQIKKAHIFLIVMWITLQIFAVPTSAWVDATYSGSWFNATQSGHGFFVQVLGNGVVVAWFVFDNNGNPQWLAGVGPITGKGFKISTVFVEGGQFPPNFDASQAETEVWGDISFEFSDCDNAIVSWNPKVPGFNLGSLALTRLSSVDGLDCHKPVSSLKDLAELVQVVIDFRRNTGGDSRLAEPLGVALLLGPLQEFNTAERLFAIGGRHTFSSGLIN